MSENDHDPQQGHFNDPTAGPDWTSEGESSSSQPTEHIPQNPTDQLPQGSGSAESSPDADVAPVAPPTPPAADAPYQGATPYPYGASSEQAHNPYAASPPPPPAAPYGAQPTHDPYAAQPAYDPYAGTGGPAQPQQPGAYPAYVPPGEWQAPPAAYGAPPAQNTSALVLTILSGIVTLSCCLPGIAPLILGIMALTKNSTDPEGSRRFTRWGWIAFGVGVALAIIAFVLIIALGVAGSLDSGGYEPDYSY